MAGQPIIEARGITKLFGPLPALDNLDLDVERGESVAVFGPNGAGKSTLFRVLTLALRPTSGSLRIDGLDPTRDDLQIKRSTGVISHRTMLYDELTARENLELYARLYGVRDPAGRAEELLQLVGLQHRAEDRAKGFSQGMQQRLTLARCLLHDPPVVYMDEPFSGLDPLAARMLRETLQRLRDQGRTVMLITHNLTEGLELSDRWLLLNRGRLIAQERSASTEASSFETFYRERLEADTRAKRRS